MKVLFRAAALLCSLSLLSACSTGSVPAYAPVSSPAVTGLPLTASPSLSPSPTPYPSPKPSPIPTPTPNPSPTPTQDPWAGFFSPEGPYLCIKDADRGPWVYKDEKLSIAVTIPQTGFFAKKYYVADVYSRGPLPFGGFAKKDPKAASIELPYKIAREYKAVLAVTGEYIAANWNPKGVIICNGVTYHDKGQATTMAILPSGEMKVYDPGEADDEKLLALGVKDSFSFGPILVESGKLHPGITKHKLGMGMACRAAIGQAEAGHYVVIVTKNGLTLTDLARLFKQWKCTVAYNLDGGHSAALVFMGEQLNKNEGDVQTQRGLPDMLMIGTCSAVPDVKAPVYGTGNYKYIKNKPKPTDGLIKQ